MSDADKPEGGDKKDKTIIEEAEMAGSQLLSEVTRLIEEGGAKRIVIRNKQGRILLEIPLVAAAAVGGAATLIAPVAAALGAMAALLAEVRVQVVRDDEDDKGEGDDGVIDVKEDDGDGGGGSEGA